MADQTHDTETSGAEIVSLTALASDVRFPVVSTLESYWHSLRGSRLVPARSEVDPRRIEDALEYAFILERVAPGMARFRLAGMHLSDLMGMEVRGMPVTAVFTPEARTTVSEALERVFDDPAIVRLSLAAETGTGRPGLDARMLFLPLKSDFGDVSRALGCLVSNGPVGRAPRRFAVSTCDVEAIAGPHHAGDRRIGGWSRAATPRGLSSAPPVPSAPSAASAPAPGLAETPGAYDRPRAIDHATIPAQHAAQQAPRPPRSDGPPKLYVVSSDG